MSMRDYDPSGGMLSLREANVGGGATAIRAQAEADASRSARDDERAEVAPTTDEASADRSRTQQTTATRQTGGAAGPSDETADLPGDASGAS